ncbi:MAG: sigma-70 family RNA polymerase sigma factor [Ruminococcus sp.]|nr:sigma-70 family RNA polymerase sigma factor [Ruminococcus sp.]MBR2303644.1 sigma-70 family RNA polymerase sigma factor [Ruminococcus sp.]
MEGKNSVSFSVLPDEELVGAAVTDIEALSELVKRYLPVVHYLSGQFPGAARDDLAQEGAMALIKAVRSYSPDKGTKFATYASRCIRNKMLSELGRNTPISEDEGTLDDFYAAEETDPERLVIEKEEARELYERIAKELSPLEWSAFMLFADQMSYGDIAKRLNVSEKSVDNAIQRARRKLRSIL